MKIKANHFEVNRWLSILEEKLVQMQFEVLQKSNQVYSSMAERFDAREEVMREIENKLQDKVEMKIMGEVLERINNLESVLNVDAY